MKTILVLLVVALIAVNGQSLCDKYSQALSLTGFQLVETVVNATIGKVVDPANKIDGFFNGKLGKTDYTTDVAALNSLRSSLDSFFGDTFALNCTDKSIPAYTGPNMTVAHGALKVDFFAFFTFNNLLLNVMTGAGVTATDAKAVAMLLDSLRSGVCNQADCTSICNKLVVPGVGTTNATVTTVVNATVFAALGNAVLAPYFTGKTGNRPDYTNATNAGKLKTLFDHLVSYFGGALGCSDGTIAAYTGQSLKDAHLNMGVTDVAFDTFNGALMGILKPFITAAEFDAVYGVLNGTRSDIVAGATSTSASTGGSTSATTGGSTSATTGGSTSQSSSKSATGGSSTSASTTSASGTPAPSTSTTGFGLVLAPVFAMFTVFLF